MSLSSDDHVTLLLSCINHSTGGKPAATIARHQADIYPKNQIDFSAVAKECNIISAGAAAKRFSRLTKAHKEAMSKGSNVNKEADGASENDSNEKDPDQTGANPAKGKRKRKAATTTKDDGTAPAKKKVKTAKNKVVVKEDPQDGEEEKGEDKDANANDNDSHNVKVKDEEEDFDIMGTVSDLSENPDDVDVDKDYC